MIADWHGTLGTESDVAANRHAAVVWDDSVLCADTFGAVTWSVDVTFGAVTRPVDVTFGAVTRPVDVTFGAITRPVDVTFGAITRSVDVTFGAVTRPVDVTFGAVTRPVDVTFGAVTRPVDVTFGAVTKPVDVTFGVVTRSVVVTFGAVTRHVDVTFGAVTRPVVVTFGAVTTSVDVWLARLDEVILGEPVSLVVLLGTTTGEPLAITDSTLCVTPESVLLTPWGWGMAAVLGDTACCSWDTRALWWNCSRVDAALASWGLSMLEGRGAPPSGVAAGMETLRCNWGLRVLAGGTSVVAWCTDGVLPNPSDVFCPNAVVAPSTEDCCATRLLGSSDGVVLPSMVAWVRGLKLPSMRWTRDSGIPSIGIADEPCRVPATAPVLPPIVWNTAEPAAPWWAGRTPLLRGGDCNCWMMAGVLVECWTLPEGEPPVFSGDVTLMEISIGSSCDVTGCALSVWTPPDTGVLVTASEGLSPVEVFSWEAGRASNWSWTKACSFSVERSTLQPKLWNYKE